MGVEFSCNIHLEGKMLKMYIDPYIEDDKFLIIRKDSDSQFIVTSQKIADKMKKYMLVKERLAKLNKLEEL